MQYINKKPCKLLQEKEVENQVLKLLSSPINVQILYWVYRKDLSQSTLLVTES